MSADERRGLLLVAVAVFFFSTSPIFIVWADPMPPIVKTWLRLSIAAVAVLLPAVVFRGGHQPESPPRSTRNSALRFALYGLIAALHFLFYVASLNYTTAAHSLSIVYTAPVFVTLFSALFLREHIRSRQWLGVAITIAGIAVLAGLEPMMTPTMAFGDLLALFSAITFGFYSVAGRYERAHTPLLVYASRVYGAAALWLAPVALLQIPSAPAGSWDWPQLFSVAALGLGPLALGHTLYNAALRRVHATYVNIIASQEVTGGIILSLIFLAQIPSPNAVAGALVTLVGIFLVLR